jgi:hypothetical protein
MPTQTSAAERLVFDGPVSPPLAIALGLALVALCGWSLWRERAILGRPAFVLFWSLRTAALGAALWMLLSPQRVRVETSTTKRAVVFAADVSDSMGTVDPSGAGDDLRWRLALSESQEKSLTAASDRALAAAGMARRHLRSAQTAIQRHESEEEIRRAVLAAQRAMERVELHLKRSRSLSDAPAGADAVRLIDNAARLLRAAEFEEFHRLAEALEKGRSPSQKGWRESLSDLDYRLVSVEGALAELSRRAAAVETAPPPGILSDRAAQGTSRLQQSTQLLQRLSANALAELEQSADIQFLTFGETVAAAADVNALRRGIDRSVRPPSGDEAASPPESTNLSSVLARLQRERRDQPVAAAFLLTDAAHNDAGADDPRVVAAELVETPVYVAPIGNPSYVRDIQLQSVSAPAVAMRNDDIVIEARLEAHACDGEACTVELMLDGETVDFREVAFDSGFATRTVRFERLMPSIGVQPFQLAIAPIAGEATPENNYRDFEVQVTRSDIKLLLADELPRWEYRYLAQLFRRDPKVECDELLFHPRLIATGRRQESGSFPVTVDEWDQYDVVLLGDITPDHLSAASQESLVEYVSRRGGTLVAIAGREAMPHAFEDHPLADLLPVVPLENPPADPREGYAFRITEEGDAHDALMIAETESATRAAWDFVNQFAPLHALSAWRQARPTAHTLIEAVPRGDAGAMNSSGNVFLCWQPVGRGRVVYLSGPETYRLRFLRGDRLHYRFWGQLLRWAIASDLGVGGRLVRIRADKSRYRTGESVRLRVQLADASGEPLATDEPLQVRLERGDEEQLAPLSPTEIPGEYVAELRSLGAGIYRAEPVGEPVARLQQPAGQEAAASFTVQGEKPLELVDTRCNIPLARQIAESAGGQLVAPTAIEEVLALTDLKPIVSERTERRALWVEWKYLWLVFGCLQIEWIIRKWNGLS